MLYSQQVQTKKKTQKTETETDGERERERDKCRGMVSNVIVTVQCPTLLLAGGVARGDCTAH